MVILSSGDGLKCYKGIILSFRCGFEVLQKNHTKFGGGGGGGAEVLQKDHTKFGRLHLSRYKRIILSLAGGGGGLRCYKRIILSWGIG